MKRLTVVIACLMALGLGFVIARNRPDENEAATLYRQALMTVLDGVTGPLFQMQNGQRAYDWNLVRRRADELPVLSGMVPESFARDTRSAVHLNSAALAYIWADPAAFAQAARRFEGAAAALQRAATDGTQSQMFGAIQTLDTACAQCHRQFRAP